MEIDVDADRQLTSQKRRREATRLDSFIENDMTDSGSDDEVSQDDQFSKWLSLSRVKTRSNTGGASAIITHDYHTLHWISSEFQQ